VMCGGCGCVVFGGDVVVVNVWMCVDVSDEFYTFISTRALKSLQSV
jgi:hypothetical protein